MIIDILGIIIGIFIVLKGADFLTEGAVSMARRINMPELIIGLTVVALGTSMPELFISLTSAFQGTTDLAVANVVGSNIFNVLLIAGVSATIAPMTVLRSTVKRDIPVTIVASILLLLCGLTGSIEQWHATIFLVFLTNYIIYSIRTSKPEEQETEATEIMSWTKSILLFVGGLCCLVAGSNIFVNGAVGVAEVLGVSEAVIGLTIVAGGTSLPELATSVVAARKGQSAIAIGNVLGSCVFNILLIIGMTGLITPVVTGEPVVINDLSYVDLGMMLLSITLFWLFSFTKYKLERWEGAVLVALFAGYMGYLVYSA